MASRRNFFLLFDMDGSTSKGRSGFNVGRGPKKLDKSTGIDTGRLWGKLCYRSDTDPDAHIGVSTGAALQDNGKMRLVTVLQIPPGAQVTTFSDGRMAITVTSEYAP